MYSQQSSLVRQLWGLPPAWTHCLENSDSVAQAEGVCVYAIVTVAEVRNTGRHEGDNVQQAVTAAERRLCKDLLAQGLLQDRQTDGRADRQTDRRTPQIAND